MVTWGLESARTSRVVHLCGWQLMAVVWELSCDCHWSLSSPSWGPILWLELLRKWYSKNECSRGQEVEAVGSSQGLGGLGCPRASLCLALLVTVSQGWPGISGRGWNQLVEEWHCIMGCISIFGDNHIGIVPFGISKDDVRLRGKKKSETLRAKGKGQRSQG